MPAYFEPEDGDFQKLTEQLVNSSSTSTALKQSAFNQISLEQATHKVAQNISSAVEEIRQENLPALKSQIALQPALKSQAAVQKTADFTQPLNSSRISNPKNTVSRSNSSQSHTTKSVRRNLKAADTAHALHQKNTSAAQTAHRLHTQNHLRSTVGEITGSNNQARNSLSSTATPSFKPHSTTIGKNADFKANATSRRSDAPKQKRSLSHFQIAWGLFSVSAAASAIIMGACHDILGTSLDITNFLIIFSIVVCVLSSAFRFFYLGDHNKNN